ncbi:MAG: hypothetical protein ACRC5H_09710 [Treponemataceae bacterium]
MNLIDVRQSVIDTLKSRIKTKGVTIEAHAGIFSEEEIKALSIKTPAILTSLVSIKDSDADETYINFVQWIITKATNTDRLYNNALLLTSAVIPVLRELEADWAFGGGQKISAECLYSGSINKMGVTLWAVSWQWKVRGTILENGESGEIPLPDILEDFEGYEATHQQGGATAFDDIDLQNRGDNYGDTIYTDT